MLVLRRGAAVALVPPTRRRRVVGAAAAVVALGVLVLVPNRRCPRVGFVPLVLCGCSTVVTVVVTVAPPAR